MFCHHIAHVHGALISLRSTATSTNTWKNVFQIHWQLRSKWEKKRPKSMDDWDVNEEKINQKKSNFHVPRLGNVPLCLPWHDISATN
jgi:hypothetical protein